MPCTRIGNAIVCTETKRCACGAPATLLCDWKFKADGARFERGTCNAPICERCAHKPAEGKDLCAKHGAQWQFRQRARANA